MAQTDVQYCTNCGSALPTKTDAARVMCVFCGVVNKIEIAANQSQPLQTYSSSNAILSEANEIPGQASTNVGAPFRFGQNARALNTDVIYNDYRNEAKRLVRNYQRSVLPLGFILLLGVAGVFYLLVTTDTNRQALFTAETLLALIMIIFSFICRGKMMRKAADLSSSKPGFGEFFKSYMRYLGWGGWPQQLNNRWRRKFLSIIEKY